MVRHEESVVPMTKQNEPDTKISKFLSYVLRHAPESVGIKLDSHGWALIVELAAKSDELLTRDLIITVVAASDKQRFALSEDGIRIRANQGHSISINLGLNTSHPPPVLYHGTAHRFLDEIMKTGLSRMQRTHVHLTEFWQVALETGSRYGRPAVLKIDTRPMVETGTNFYLTANNVWLVDSVPPNSISYDSETEPQTT